MSGVTNADFLEAMFADLPDGAAAMVCGFAGDPLAVNRGAWFAKPWMFGKPLPGCGPMTNNYLAVSSFLPDPETGKYRRRKANFERLHAVMLDDLGDGPGAKLPMRHADRLPVSALVETSPRNYQAWLFLEADDDTDDRERGEKLIKSMITHGLAADKDPGMRGVTRYGRLPVGGNGKAAYRQDDRAFPVRLVRWSPEFRYTVKEVVQAFHLDVTPEAKRPQLSVPKGRAAARVSESFDRLIEELRVCGLYFGHQGDGTHLIKCPWFYEHKFEDTTGTYLFEPNAENYWCGGFKCWHGHCENRTISNVYRFVREHTWLRLREEVRAGAAA